MAEYSSWPAVSNMSSIQACQLHIFPWAHGDIKQNGTEVQTPYSDIAFNALSHGVLLVLLPIRLPAPLSDHLEIHKINSQSKATIVISMFPRLAKTYHTA